MNATIRSEIKQAMNEEHKRIDIGPAGIAFANCNMDPLDQGGANNPKAIGAPYPDGHAVDGMTFTATATATFAGATATSCFISFLPPNLTNGGQIDITYGEEAMDDTKTMTAVSTVNYAEYLMINTVIPAVGNRVRILGSAINVVPTSAADMTSGYLHAYESANPLRSAAATWRTNISLRASPIGNAQPLAAGMTVRGKLYTSRMAYESVPAQYANHDFNIGPLPIVAITGMGANTTVKIECALHYQVRVAPLSIPMAILASPIEPELLQLCAWINRQPHVTTGHSFGSFFKSVWSGFKKTFGFVQNALNVVGPVVGTLDRANWQPAVL
jgi:hypothetical protein